MLGDQATSRTQSVWPSSDWLRLYDLDSGLYYGDVSASKLLNMKKRDGLTCNPRS